MYDTVAGTDQELDSPPVFEGVEVPDDDVGVWSRWKLIVWFCSLVTFESLLAKIWVWYVDWI